MYRKKEGIPKASKIWIQPRELDYTSSVPEMAAAPATTAPATGEWRHTPRRDENSVAGAVTSTPVTPSLWLRLYPRR